MGKAKRGFWVRMCGDRSLCLGCGGGGDCYLIRTYNSVTAGGFFKKFLENGFECDRINVVRFVSRRLWG